MKDYDLLDGNGQATPLSNFLAAHRGYRRDAERFPKGVRALAAWDFPADGLEALRRHWVGFDQALLSHHQMEDAFLFPLYRGKHPELGEVVDQLEIQHEDLDERIGDIDGLLAKLPAPDVVDQTVAAFVSFDAVVNQHLDLEEQHIVPLMVAEPPVPPGGGPPPVPENLDFAFVGPWLADGLDDSTVAALLAVAPPPFTVGFDENRQRYEDQLRRWLP